MPCITPRALRFIVSAPPERTSSTGRDIDRNANVLHCERACSALLAPVRSGCQCLSPKLAAQHAIRATQVTTGCARRRLQYKSCCPTFRVLTTSAARGPPPGAAVRIPTSLDIRIRACCNAVSTLICIYLFQTASSASPLPCCSSLLVGDASLDIVVVNMVNGGWRRWASP